MTYNQIAHLLLGIKIAEIKKISETDKPFLMLFFYFLSSLGEKTPTSTKRSEVSGR